MRERVLLIEDDADAARLIDRALVDAGFAVHRVATGEQGLDYVGAHGVGGIVLDYRLPLADGLQTLRRLRERRITTPVVMISSAGTIDVAVQAIKADAFDFVEKHHNYLPVLVDRVRAAIGDARRRSGRHVARTVSVGRDAERRALGDELARTMAGAGRVVLVTGEDGIGKTTLALEVERLATGARTLVLWGRCRETDGAPAYWPWTQVLRGYEEIVGPERLREELGAAARLVARPGAPLVAGPELVRFQLLDGVTQWLRRTAAARPLVLLFDDLHHADPPSLELLRFLSAEIRDVPLLVVGTHQTGGTPTPAHVELARIAEEPFTTVVSLTGFSEEEVRRYVTEATGVRPSDALVRVVHEKTEGHPVFVAEVIRLLAADGRLGEEPTGGSLRLAIPETRRHAIADGLARLSSGCRAVLAVAAVIGREFDGELLARVVDDADGLDAVLAEAAEAGLVVGSADGPYAYRFSQALVRDALYDELPATERAGYHARLARALETAAPPATEPPLAAIAHHYLLAAVGAEDAETAVEYAVAAGDHAAALMAHEEAARHYEEALRAAERVPSAASGTLARVLGKLVGARWRAGDLAEARAVGRRLLRLAKETGVPAAVASAALAFAGRLPGLGAVVCDEEVVAELEGALAGLPPTATAQRAMLMARLAEELSYSPRRTIDRGLAPRAITLARALDDPAVLAAVLRTTQWSVWTPDDVERRRQLAEEIVALAAQTDDPVLALDGEILRLWSAFEHGEIDAARRQLALAIRLAERLRLPYYSWITVAARACLHFATGRLDDAERVADEALRAGDPATNPAMPLFVGAQREHILWHRGQFEEVARWLADVVPEFPMLASAVECSLALTYAEAGQRERAQAELTRLAADDFVCVPRNVMWLMNMTSLAEACAALGDVEIARRLYPHLAPFARYNVTLVPAWVGASVSRYMAGLAAVLDDVEAARRHYEDALVMETRTGTRQWLARTQLAYARHLRAWGRPADGERVGQLVAAARAIAVELGLRPVLDAIAAFGDVPTAPRVDRRCVFRRRDDVWDLAYLGQAASARHRVGMEHLRRLLERPGVPTAAIELASAGGEGILIESDGDAMLDRRAVGEYCRRRAELEERIAECARDHEPSNVDALREELEALEDTLREQGRAMPSAAERARTSVTKAIDRAIRDITDRHEALGRHLRLHVKTGRFCVYVPDVASPVAFDL